MKKLLSILLALLMIAPMLVVATASEMDYTKTFSIYTGDSSAYYNQGCQVDIVLALRGVDFGEDDGISALEFELSFDKNRLEPMVNAATDSDGDSGDFTSLMTINPGCWEGFGVMDSAKGKYSLVFSDIMGGGTVLNDDELVITIPFKVKDDVKVNDLVFNFDNVIAYNTSMEIMSEIDLNSIIVKYSAQPLNLVDLPSNAISLQVAGYRHDINNVVYYAKSSITVGSFIRNYCEPTVNQDKMSTFAILVADLNGIVSYVDIDVSSDSDKSSVMIPAESYIIGVSSGNTADYNKFVSEVAVGKRITIYNVNIEATGGLTTAFNLTNAGFTVSALSENQPPFVGGDEPATPAPEPPEPDIMVGDVNGNGMIDSLDYIFIKRAYFGNYDIADIRVGDVNKNGMIDSLDYIFIKRAYFDNYTI